MSADKRLAIFQGSRHKVPLTIQGPIPHQAREHSTAFSNTTAAICYPSAVENCNLFILCQFLLSERECVWQGDTESLLPSLPGVFHSMHTVVNIAKLCACLCLLV